jgi:hypothetical protein
VAEALAKDPRPPILYLRPFKADKIRYSTMYSRLYWVRFVVRQGTLFLRIVRGEPNMYVGEDPVSSAGGSGEELVVSLLDPLGPVIAIGRPKERIPPAGAARLYVGDEWKDVVHDLLNRAQMVLMFAGRTPHFEWELRKVFQNETFAPTILILPFFRRYRQRRVSAFVSMFFSATGIQVSPDLRRVRAIYFPSRSEAIEIKDKGTKDERALNALNPFLGAIAQIMELSRPGWTDIYLGSAQQMYEWNKRALLSAPFVLIGVLWWIVILVAQLRGNATTPVLPYQ